MFEFIPDITLRTWSAEDLIIQKAFEDDGVENTEITGGVQSFSFAAAKLKFCTSDVL